jgi:uncharacterized protein YcaQ
MRRTSLGRETISASLEGIRRLAVARQHLAGRPPKAPSKEDILGLVRDLGYVQWDPVPILAPSHVLTIWSRLGDFRLADLDKLLWEDKKLLLHWTPQACIVLAEDFPIHRSLMERYPGSLAKGWRNHIPRAKKYLADRGLKERVLAELRDGPLTPTQFKCYQAKKSPDGWSSGSDVSNMLFHLHMRGEVMVVGRQRNQNLYGLTDEFFPDLAKTDGLSEEEYELRAAERALRALGTAKEREIFLYFVRGRYQHLGKALERLAEEGRILPVKVEGLTEKGQRYVHESDVKTLESMETDEWEPRVSFLPPFDNMLSGGRLKSLFGFEYAREQFLPKEKRKFGTYVLPIIWGDRFIGRIDAAIDRRKEALIIHSIHAEPGAPKEKQVASEVGETAGRLAGFLGAKEVQYSARVPGAWKSTLH